MESLDYFLRLSWLAHKEMGLEPLVRVQCWVTAALLAAWLVERAVRAARRPGTSPGPRNVKE